jgi:inositol-phosphate phosphatase/L-galactose 1-phosphate phosphatase/histidinol-phosphatase
MADPDPGASGSSAYDPNDYVDFAHRLANAAGAVVRKYFRARVAVEDKDDASPVTVADREAEASMRALIAIHHPAHGILGEEEGAERDDADLVWVLDPIDGTKAFIAGKPTFVTLIALVRNGTPVLGVIDQPIARERWIGVAGSATLFNGEAVSPRACANLDQAILNTTSPDLFTGDDARAFRRLSAAVKDTLYGGDGYAYGLLAGGFIDLVAEADLKPYDFCALVPVVEGAGGVMTDWRGQRLTVKSDGRVVAAGDRAMHELALDALDATGVSRERA